MAPKANPFAEEWNAIHQHFLLLTTPDEAVKKADSVVKALQYNYEYSLEQIKLDKSRARKHLRNNILGWVAAGLVLFLIACGIFFINKMYADDWGGYDKSKVYGANSQALTEWYGKNDNVDNFRMVEGPTRDRLAGKEAWLTVYTRPDNGKRVCVRVRENEPYYNISENEGCDASSSG